MEDFLRQYAGEMLTAIIAGFAGWFFQRKKQEVEVHGSEIENADRVLKYYREMVDDLGIRLKEAIVRLNEAETIIKNLEATVEALTDELKKYKQLNGKVNIKKGENDAISN